MRLDSIARMRARLVIASLVVLAGCAANSAGEPATATPEHAPRIQVNNDNWNQVTVYALREGLAVRLGTVTTGTTAVFDLPATMQRGVDVRLLVQPLASWTGYVSPPIEFGRDMTLTVANALSQSTLVPWRSTG